MRDIDCQAACQPAGGMDPILVGLSNLAMMVPGALVGLAVCYLALRAYRMWVKQDQGGSTNIESASRFEAPLQPGDGKVDMNNPDDDERHLRIELMRLDRKLKLLDVRRMDQQLAYAPVKLLLLAAVVLGGTLAALLAVS